MPDRDRFGGSERDYLPSGPAEGVSRLGDLPGARIPRDFWDRRFNRDTTTVPEGFNAPDRFGRMRPSGATNPYAAPIDNNPMRGANIGGGWNMYEGAPERRSPWQPYLLDKMGSGSYLSSRYGGGLDDIAGMNENARGMIEGAGFDVAASEGMTDKRTFRELWRQSVNKFAPGTSNTTIKQEFNRLKNIFMKKKYGFKPPGPLGIGMDLGLDFLESEQGQELFEQFDPNREPIVI